MTVPFTFNYYDLSDFCARYSFVRNIEKIIMSNMSKKFHQLAPDLTICRIVNGMWQVAGGHGDVNR